MKGVEFPILNTKVPNLTKTFDLADPVQRKDYFKQKAGSDIEKLKQYLKENTFIIYLLGKKGSGKSTCINFFKEAIGAEKIEHFAVGDIMRAIESELEDKDKEKELLDFLKREYRGFISPEKALDLLRKVNMKVLLPAELVLALVKREISKKEKKALFIDGFPRDLDQISYSLFFRDLTDYRKDPDVFALFDIPETILDERMKYRRICPKCQLPRNLKVLISKEIGFDKEKQEFYLICENPECEKERMVKKQGADLGIEEIRQRLNAEEELMKKAQNLYGISKILLRNSVPMDKAKDFIDEYEITPEYSFEWDEQNQKVKVIKKPWVILDDNNVPSFSVLAPVMALSLIKQLVKVLNLQ